MKGPDYRLDGAIRGCWKPNSPPPSRDRLARAVGLSRDRSRRPGAYSSQAVIVVQSGNKFLVAGIFPNEAVNGLYGRIDLPAIAPRRRVRRMDSPSVVEERCCARRATSSPTI